ncbi:hypothetical protein Cni_G18868 [Canna indica]|uniref:C2 domain-containing protein n=1 Tax=Canna indica TaxID=4628 RepID=A0AAQ3KL62_9LILI|nr:hypothetical protein Cni_G18868 [Canna indica]
MSKGRKGKTRSRMKGSSKYYVNLQYGSQSFTSKLTEEDEEKIWWNEKFTFELPSAEWKDMAKLKLSIMEKDKFHDEDLSVGEAMVYLRSVLREGNQKGFLQLKPAPYNVVLKDGTFKGEVKVGLKFISTVDVETEGRGCNMAERKQESIYRTILSFTVSRIPWPRFLFLCSRPTHPDSKKHI